ncbi:hypothetical protein I6J35_07960 [Staphylococcus condimenti]|uniref:Phage protein n=1 Tax=Staphylococcus condimenti TaxID=70255 RepID=A0AB37H091_9STAP|nr:hypothetical protein [Staphylococcus condimenti]MDK8646449.1 hypothetical protein [Staphylococcus condimenti]QQS82938.1 hypothetical protein I6J05_01070 [Staphylococcus condimenti]QRP94628.1 hypothetical protein I6J35_07960 [Staphylococcus condimenti]VEG64849.1 Uncharacterised protein [Staphylococcus condimenti]
MIVRMQYTLTFEKDIEVDTNDIYLAEEKAVDEIYKNKEDHADGEVIEADNITMKWAVE